MLQEGTETSGLSRDEDEAEWTIYAPAHLLSQHNDTRSNSCATETRGSEDLAEAGEEGTVADYRVRLWRSEMAETEDAVELTNLALNLELAVNVVHVASGLYVAVAQTDE